MQIEPATCPACGAAYDPLRAQAVTVIDGRVRAFCSVACRERGLAPPSPPKPPTATDSHVPIVVPRVSLWRGMAAEQRVLGVAAVLALAGFVTLIMLGRQRKTAASTLPAVATAPKVVDTQNDSEPAIDSAAGEVWIQPLARAAHAVVKHDARLFFGREGLPASECAGVHCAIEIDAAAGAVVMAVHDGVIEAVERNPKGEPGRFIRINHKGGAFASSYLQLDGIREDLEPGIPVHAGEPIATVGRATSASEHPHFRFAMAVSGAGGVATLFIDPQPLLALWPMRHEANRSLRAMQRGPATAAADDDASGSRATAGRADSSPRMR